MRKWLIILLLPLAVLVFMVGWMLYYLGSLDAVSQLAAVQAAEAAKELTKQ